MPLPSLSTQSVNILPVSKFLTVLNLVWQIVLVYSDSTYNAHALDAWTRGPSGTQTLD